MPKRGLTQPWRVIYVWENGVKGCNTYGTWGDAQLFVDALRHRAEMVEARIAIKVVNRIEDTTPNTKHYKILEAAL